jgi:DNA-binding FadR family transcriptional regulator
VLLRTWKSLGPASWTSFSGIQQHGFYSLIELAERHVVILDAMAAGDPANAGETARRHTLGIAAIVASALEGATGNGQPTPDPAGPP